MPQIIKEFTDKKCEHCGGFFNRKRRLGGLEDTRSYKRRKFCSRECFVLSIKEKSQLFIEERKKRIKEYSHYWYLNYGKGKNKKRHPSRKQIPCHICGKIISLQPNQVRENNYCGLKCRNIAYSYRTGEKSPRWKGGRLKDKNGYVDIRIHPNSPFFPMTGERAYVREHRIVMAINLGRCLEPWEIVHHINGVKDDNRIENLKLIPEKGDHNTLLNKAIIKLQMENAELREHIKKLEQNLWIPPNIFKINVEEKLAEKPN